MKLVSLSDSPAVAALAGGIALVSLCAAPSTPDQLFQRPRHLCFSPPAYSSPSSLRLLVAEDGARRVQEVSVEGGEHIRYIGKGIIDGSIDGTCSICCMRGVFNAL